MQVYGLVGQTEEGIWPEAQLRAIFLPRSDQPVRKLAYCPQAHVLFVKYDTDVRIKGKSLRCHLFFTIFHVSTW